MDKDKRQEEAEEIAVPVVMEEMVDDRDGPHPADKKGTDQDDSKQGDEDAGPPLGPG